VRSTLVNRKDLSTPFYGYNRPGAKISEGVRESFWLQGMMAGFPASYFCIKAFSETDQTEDLKKFDVPTLILQGDDDQIVPYTDAALLQAKLILTLGQEVFHQTHPGIGEQLMIAPCRFDADAATRREPLEKGKQCRPLISDLAHGEAAFRTGHYDLVLGNVGADIAHYFWGLHDVFPLTKLRGAGMEHTGVSLRSNRRS
jgi:hypothetical protein